MYYKPANIMQQILTLKTPHIIACFIIYFIVKPVTLSVVQCMFSVHMNCQLTLQSHLGEKVVYREYEAVILQGYFLRFI